MTPPGPTPLFLERVRYRQRRLRDAARLTPILGIILWALPLLWSGDSIGAKSQTLVYVFCVWVALIVIAAVLSCFLRDDDQDSQQDESAD